MDWLEKALEHQRSRSETCYETGGEIVQKKVYLYMGIPESSSEYYIKKHKLDKISKSHQYQSANQAYKSSISLRSREGVDFLETRASET